jgi:hypothetical protein
MFPWPPHSPPSKTGPQKHPEATNRRPSKGPPRLDLEKGKAAASRSVWNAAQGAQKGPRKIFVWGA